MSGLVLPRLWKRLTASTTVVLLAIGFTAAGGLVSTARADASPFQVTVTPSAATIASGQQLTYTIDVKNAGGDITTETMLNAQIQGMTSLVLTSNVGGCTLSANQLTCTAGILQGQQSWQVTVRGTVTAANGTSLNQGVTVTGNHTSSGYQTTSYASVLVNNNATGPLPNLMTSVQAPASIADNSNATFQVTVNNAGNANATGVTEIATLPDGFSYTSATGNSLFSCVNQPALSRTIVCTGGRVNAGANATITVVGNANNQPAGSQLKFTAVVDPYDQIQESNELDNTGSAVPTSAPDPVQQQLTVTKTDSPDPLRPGDKLTYTIDVKNIAATRADNVSLSDTTQGLDAASVTAVTNVGACTIAAAKVTCTQKSPTLRLDPGQVMHVTITGTVVASANSLVTNVATATAVIKNKAVTNTAATTTTVRPGVDLSVVQSAVNNHDDITTTPGNDWFRAFDHFQYDVSVGNSGMDDATNVVLREVVAPGVKYLGHLDGAGLPEADVPGSAVDCDQTATGSPIVCTVVTVNGSPTFGTTRNFSLLVVSPPGTGAITATATVDPANAIFEPDETNNVSTVTTPIDTGVDLTVSKSSPEKVAPSGTLIYTIVVSNLGTQDATGVRLRDVLPTGTRFRSVHEVIAAGDPGHNFTCSSDGSATAGDVTCVGGNLRGTHDHNLGVDSATIELKAFAPAAPGMIRNQVKVDPNGDIPELLETNNFNTWDTQIVIDSGCCVYQELNLTKTQVFPNDGSGNATPVKPSGIVEYDLKVKNDGTQVAFGVAVQDVMPSGFAYRSAVDTVPGTGAFQCGVSGQTIMCTGGTLDGSDQQTALAGDNNRTIHVSLFANSQPGTYTNTATVDPQNTIPEADETNNSATAITTVSMTGGGDYIDFKVDSKQSSPGSDGTAVVPHGLLQYNLDVTNAGTAVAFNVKVRDVLPAGSVFRSATDTGPTTGNFNCSESGGVVTCVGGTLDGASTDETPSPSTRTIVIQVFAPNDIDTFHNTAMVDPDNAVAENDETNNTDQTDTDVRRNGLGTYRDLTVNSVTASNATPAPGETYSYDVKVSNTGTNPVFNLKLSNTLDAGPTFVGATAGNNFQCAVTDSVVTCTGGVLDGSLNLDAADDNTTITLSVKAPQVDQFQYDLRSVIDPDNAVPESDEANNTGKATVKTKSLIDLTFDSLTSSGGKGSSGDVSWTLHNLGTADAKNVYVVVNMSVGSIPQQMSTLPDGWSCQIEADPINKVTCHGDLAAGATAPFKVDTFVTADNPHSNGFVDPDNSIIESNENNNAKQG